MQNKFLVINLRKIILTFGLIILLVLVSIGGDFLVSEIIEANASNRLLPIYSVETVDKVVALTFDCAWGVDDIPDIIDTLTKNDVKAAFFMVGDWIEKNPEAVKLMHEHGMDIGNHSDSHAHVNNLSYEKNIEDMKKCNEKIKNITGEETRLYRGPYGEYNNTVITAAESLNMKVIQWDVDTLTYINHTVNSLKKQ